MFLVISSFQEAAQNGSEKEVRKGAKKVPNGVPTMEEQLREITPRGFFGATLEESATKKERSKERK